MPRSLHEQFELLVLYFRMFARILYGNVVLRNLPIPNFTATLQLYGKLPGRLQYGAASQFTCTRPPNLFFAVYPPHPKPGRAAVIQSERSLPRILGFLFVSMGRIICLAFLPSLQGS
jgi:hypothetical protein